MSGFGWSLQQPPCGHCFSTSLYMKKRGMLILPSTGQPKREILHKYEKTFQVRVSFYIQPLRYYSWGIWTTQSFLSRPKCRHIKIFIKLFIVPTNPVQNEDSEEYSWPLLLPKLFLQPEVLTGHVIISVIWLSYKIYQVVNPDSRKWQLSQTINFLCLNNFDYLFSTYWEDILV